MTTKDSDRIDKSTKVVAHTYFLKGGQKLGLRLRPSEVRKDEIRGDTFVGASVANVLRDGGGLFSDEKNMFLKGARLDRIDGSDVTQLKFNTIADLLQSMAKEPKIMTFVVEEKEEQYSSSSSSSLPSASSSSSASQDTAKRTKSAAVSGDEGFICPNPTCRQMFKCESALRKHYRACEAKNSDSEDNSVWSKILAASVAPFSKISAWSDQDEGSTKNKSEASDLWAYRATVRALKSAIELLPAPSGDDETDIIECVERLRMLSSTFAIPRLVLPTGVSVKKFECFGQGGVPAEVYQTTDVATKCTWLSADPALRTMLYFHGGGYALMSPATHRHFLSRLTLCGGMQIVAIDYRKPPKYPFPAPVADVAHAFRWIVRRLGIKPDRVVFAGDSAGGGLCVSSMVALRDMGCELPAAAVLLSPWLDLTDVSSASWTKNADSDFLSPRITRVFARAYSGSHPSEMHGISPVFADLSGLPPLLIEVGGNEVFLDQCVRFSARAKEQSVDVTCRIRDGMAHCFSLWANIFETSKSSFDNICSFVDLHTSIGDSV
eukprot:g3139.t1